MSVFGPGGERWLRNRLAALLDPTEEDNCKGLHFAAEPIVRPDGTVYEVNDYPIARALRGESVAAEELLMKSQGVYRRYVTSVGPVYDHDGSIVAAVCVWDDVTDRQNDLEELESSSRLFSAIAEATPDVIYLFDLVEKRDIYFNSRLTALLGYTSEEFEKIGIHRLLHPQERETIRALLAGFAARTDSDVVTFESRMLHKSGEWVWFLNRAVVFAREESGTARVILGLAQDITERKRNDEALRQIREDLELRVAERTVQLLRAEEQVRHRVARELHDEMGQSVTALKIGLESLKYSSPSPRRVEQLTRLAEKLDRQIDRLAHELRPSELDELGVAAALANHLEQFSELFGIAVDYHHSGIAGERLPPTLEQTLYRVVQEALTNVLKHASAVSVSVILEKRDAQIQLIIEDDGCGFSVDEAVERHPRSGGLGLAGMQERVASVGGALKVESSIGGGTSIFVRLNV
jgi:PAS domain S-box-containing protein